ncbi:Holo-[acyl-carrier-protein] synthase [Mycena kentingensis (nom. inval.)]|nr:Holo-[acyl-carrier-protein] synthase [Mycena kentingensis (nom. inval.)]
MPILGIGVDVVFVPRIAALLSRYPERLPARILSPLELQRASSLGDPQFIAVRWAVKEAAYKAIYPAHRPSWKDFTYRGLTNGHKPVLLYHPPSNTVQVGTIHVSVSHDGDYVFASVLVETAEH